MSTVEPVEVLAPADEDVLTREALDLVVRLQRELNPRRRELLERRREVQAELDAGGVPGFLPGTREIREGDWQVAPAPPDLRDRRCEITGPVDRKMMINALNSGARVFMADYEDANSPTWTNVVEGQRNVSDAVRRTIALAEVRALAFRGLGRRELDRSRNVLRRGGGDRLRRAHAAASCSNCASSVEPLSASVELSGATACATRSK